MSPATVTVEAGKAISATATAQKTGDVGTITYSIEPNSGDKALSIDTNGAITGNIAYVGTYTYTVKASATIEGETATKTITFTG